MNCYKPGEILILPEEGGYEGVVGHIYESLNEKLEILYSVEDLLNFYHLSGERLISQFGALPFVVKVPEGRESSYVNQLRSITKIKASVPNYYIHSSQTDLKINAHTLDASIEILNCHVRNPACGQDVKIAIIDTGVDREILPNPEKLHPVQFTTDKKPQSSEEIEPHDPVGHGSIVAYIINSISPSSAILSVKMMESMGTVGGLIAGIYLAEAEFKPDIYNLSLKLSCDPDICDVCGHNRSASVNSYQLRLLFSFLDKRADSEDSCNPLIVAAAGNGGKHISMPASFPNVLAVGSFDIERNDVAAYSDYKSIPEDRYILAPGGFKFSDRCIAHKKDNSWGGMKYFYGTSFSAAFVSAVSARYLCSTKESPCKNVPDHIGGRNFVMACLRESSKSNSVYVDPLKSGLGVLRYDWSIIPDAVKSILE